MTSTLPPLVQAFSGAIGSASANVLTYPLDLVATRVQLDPPASTRKHTGIRRAAYILYSIIRRDGIARLYDGVATDTGATILSNFLYFYLYSFLRTRTKIFRDTLRPNNKPLDKLVMIEELVLGFTAGVLSRLVSTPLSMITLRLQALKTADEESDEETEEGGTTNAGIIAATKDICREHGLPGFWRGFQTTTLLSLNPSLTLTLFQFFRRLLSIFERGSLNTASPNQFPKDPNPAQAFIGAAVSNSIAAAILYPLILAKTRLQASPATSLREVIYDAYNGVDTYSYKRYRRSEKVSGAQGLYQGLEVQILKGFLNQGVTFFVKGRIEEMIARAYLRRQRPTRALI